MEIFLKELEKINKIFEPASRIKNKGSLDFAIEHAARTKDWMKELAYLLRAIVIDHAFDDGNKRTAGYLIFKFFKEHGAPLDDQKVDKLIIKIASGGATDIKTIRRLIHDATI